MKGLTHFMTGICVATFFPLVMTAVYTSDRILLTLLIPLGGFFGYLPDFLDFKFSRYVATEEYVTNPGFKEYDPWKVADTIAQCINEAYEENKTIRLKLQTIRMPNGLWRRYSVLFRLKQREVYVKIGPLISTGLEVMRGTEPEEDLVAIVRFKPELYYSYEDVTNVDIWDGPTFEFKREGNRVITNFIQWHRQWSHSLTLGVILGFFVPLGVGIYYNLQGNPLTDYEILTLAGIITGGIWGHVLVDQLGWLGSNLFWPVTGKRKTGLGLTRSMDPLANFTTTYILAMLIIWNMNRFAPEAVFEWPITTFVITVIILPLAVITAAVISARKKHLEENRTRSEEELHEVSMEIAEF